MQGCLVREERGGMCFWPHAKLNYVKSGNAISAKDLLHLTRISKRCCVTVLRVSWHAMDLAGRSRHFAEKSSESHAIVAIFTIGRNRALIGPEDLNKSPIDLVAV